MSQTHKWIARWYEGWKDQPLTKLNESSTPVLISDYGRDKDGIIQLLLVNLNKAERAIPELMKTIDLLEAQNEEYRQEAIKFARAIGLSVDEY